MSSKGLAAQLPASLAAERHGSVAVLKLNRPQKRNALDDETIIGIEQFFTSLPEDIGAVLIAGEGEHFSAGLDLTELKERDVAQGIAHSGLWHRAFDKIQFGKVPVVAVLHGAVVGGGLELAASDACARRRAFGLLRAAGRQPRHLCRRRRLGAIAAADRRRAHDGHDADRPHLFRGRRPGHRSDYISCRERERICQGPRAGAAHRGKCAADQFRGHARAAADRAR